MRSTTVALAVSLGMLAGGCSSGSVARDTYRGVPFGADETAVNERLLTGEPLLTWLEDGEAFAITTWGSSSCPPVATEVHALARTVTVRFRPADQKVCTADLGPTTHEFGLPDGASDDVVVAVQFGSGTAEETHILTAP